jgi:glycosyltransferase involved in cell wall biosynthesis
MRIVIFHYHLNPGGVTRIVESQVKALKKLQPDLQVKVITGGCLNQVFFKELHVPLIINDVLNYLTDISSLDEKLDQILGLLKREVTKDDIIHFHNLNLGKNPLVTLAVGRLVNEGYRVLNHAHDFSEDRPANHQFLKETIVDYFNENLEMVMYPSTDNYHFATLNSFDLERLWAYGVLKERCHLLANPVVFQESETKGTPMEWRKEICTALNINTSKKIITYPVRVIRRKNIGEFILLAVLFAKKAEWIVTQPPKNPLEIKPYEQWKEFCEKEQISIHWEAGNKVDFEKLLKVSDFCISTSIQEGFGMVFMEPWLLGTPVVGRNIPMVTRDMTADGIEFTCLYDSLEISKGKQLHEFDMNEQMELIRALKENTSMCEEFIEKHPSIKNMLNDPESGLIARNKEVILKKYSLSNYGMKLYEAYRGIIK